MANEQFAFLKSSNVPTREKWQQAIDRAGFDLNLDSTLEPRTNVGFVPCKLNGADSGIEMYFEDSTDSTMCELCVSPVFRIWCSIGYTPGRRSSLASFIPQATPRNGTGVRAMTGDNKAIHRSRQSGQRGIQSHFVAAQ